jgi:hypothetical protein
MNKLFSASISTMALSLSSGLLLAQPDIDTVRIRELTWMPCDTNASDRACQLAVIRGTSGKAGSDGKVVLIMIKGTAAIDANREQEQESMPGSDEYVYIPPKPSLWSGQCIFYGCVEGPSMYYLREKK